MSCMLLTHIYVDLDIVTALITDDFEWFVGDGGAMFNFSHVCGRSDGKTAMHLAVEGGHPHIVRSLFYAFYWLGLKAPNLNIKDK